MSADAILREYRKNDTKRGAAVAKLARYARGLEKKVKETKAAREGLVAKAFEGRDIRVVIIEGEPWFVGRDVADILGYKNESSALDRHCRGVAKRYPIIDALGREQEARLISEPDLYRLIIASKLPEAERFEAWVFEDVLPSIRRTGRYAIPEKERKDSSKARSFLTGVWRDHGADKPHHYINLTRKEYEVLGYGRNAKKDAMDRKQLARLMAFEAFEGLKLLERPTSGYYELADSLEETGRHLTFLVDAVIAGKQIEA